MTDDNMLVLRSSPNGRESVVMKKGLARMYYETALEHRLERMRILSDLLWIELINGRTSDGVKINVAVWVQDIAAILDELAQEAVALQEGMPPAA